MQKLVDEYVSSLNHTLKSIDVSLVESLCQRLIKLREDQGTLYICGNGGSAANAMHIANDFTFGVHPEGRSINVEALSSNSSVLTCIGNDTGYENIFAHQLKVKGKSADLLLVLSGSGNSANIIKVLQEAKVKEMTSIAILGFDGGEAKELADIVFHFEVNDMQVSEDTQLVIGHILMKALYKELKG